MVEKNGESTPRNARIVPFARNVPLGSPCPRRFVFEICSTLRFWVGSRRVCLQGPVQWRRIEGHPVQTGVCVYVKMGDLTFGRCQAFLPHCLSVTLKAIIDGQARGYEQTTPNAPGRISATRGSHPL